MGLPSFLIATEGLLPLLAMNTALSVSHMKSTWRSVLQVITSCVAAEAKAKARDTAPLDEGAARRSVRVKWFEAEAVCPEMSAAAAANDCCCYCCVCLCRFEAEEEVSELNCKHFFHRECLERCFENDHRTCPLCLSLL